MSIEGISGKILLIESCARGNVTSKHLERGDKREREGREEKRSRNSEAIASAVLHNCEQTCAMPTCTCAGCTAGARVIHWLFIFLIWC
jgi:hypothetical protein